MKRTAAFLTLGCKVNQYETDAMKEILEQKGYEIVPFKEEADVYVIHTCSVTNMADKKSRQMIHRARRRNRNAVIVAVGCYVQANREELADNQIADILIGTNRKNEIGTLLDAYFEEQERRLQEAVINIGEDKTYESMVIHHVSGHTRAYLKIQDGCNQFCSYCIIPYTRGRIRSEQPDRILQEVKQLAANGLKEIVLTGIHLDSYGKDLGDVALIDIIEMIQQVDGIERIRLGSLEPRIITEDFVKRLVRCSKVCPHFHLSLQSGCDDTLRRMNRHYTTKRYEEALALLRAYYDRPALTTDVIAGFVGESEEEFAQTREYLERINLYEMHIFKYSVREGTRAQKMEGHIGEDIKGKRSQILLDMAADHKKAYEELFIGEDEEILLEEEITVDGRTYMQGYTRRYVRVAVPQDLTAPYGANQLIPVMITKRLDGELLLGQIR